MIKIEAAARLKADKWISDVETKHHTPEGLFSKGADAIAKELKKEHGDLKGAVAALNFYYNRKGKNKTAEDNDKHDAALAKLHSLFGEEE